jgi:anaerobic magnesium-protoporphyrin IX monomethyl ester cyclase
MKRKLVLLINPPNSSTLDGRTTTVGNPAEHSDWSNYPAAGILSLASSLRGLSNIQPVYLDGVVCPIDQIYDFIASNRNDIAAIGVSALTDTYEAGLKIFEYSRNLSTKIVHIIGNDHFTALPVQCMNNQSHLIDYGFNGNEIIGSFRHFIDRLVNGFGITDDLFPGMVRRQLKTKNITSRQQTTEPIFTQMDYSLIDEMYSHTPKYDRRFNASLPDRMKHWFGRQVSRGIPIEIARGCIKFQNDNACSFCSIQYGGLWKNSVPDAEAAWHSVYQAHKSGYDYFYITADELAITFRELLLSMRENMPDWLLRLPLEQRPILTGYARSDGLILGQNADLLHDLGFRLIMVGVDAGPKISLKAVNKHLAKKQERNSLDRLYEANLKAFDLASKAGLRLRIGFVAGHVGMTKELLEENVKYFCSLIDNNPKAVAVADIEILSPEPGSKEYHYLTNPTLASQIAHELNLSISNLNIRSEIAEKWRERDIINREELINDYVKAFMPDISAADLIAARIKMRNHCRDNGILVGEP